MGKNEETNPDSQYGEPVQFDPTFNGPIRKRGCTDIICCVLFFAVILGYFAVGILAWLYGDPRQVLYPRNSTGWFCGTGPNTDRPALLYFDIVKCATGFNVMAAALNGLQCPTTQICVKMCPTDFSAVGPLDYAPNVKPADVFNQSLCAPSLDLSKTDMTVKDIVDNELCPFYTIPTTSVIGRCLPDVKLLGNMPQDFSDVSGLPPSVSETVNLLKNGTGDVLNGFSARDIGVRIFEDFASSWPWILAGLAISMVLSMSFLLLLRFTARFMVWILIIAVLCTGAYGIWHCYWEYTNYKNLSASINDIGFTTNFSFYLKVQETWLAFLIILSVVEAILILVLIFLRTRIFIAIALIQESSRAIGQMMSTLFYPLLTFVLLLVCVAYWGSTALYLATSGEAVYKVVALNSSMNGCQRINGTVDCDPQIFKASDYPTCPSAACIFVKYNDEGLFQRNLFNLQIYNVVAFLWSVNFVIALGQCTLAGAFSAYYWAFVKPDDIPVFPLFDAFVRTLRYHVGSLAFGALILTIVQGVRVLLEYIDHKTRTAQNPCARFLLCCMKCCFWCLEKFFKFLNRNAYIMIAVYGKNFCTSAKNAFSLIMRNIIRRIVLLLLLWPNTSSAQHGTVGDPQLLLDAHHYGGVWQLPHRSRILQCVQHVC
ncbi:choline transporter-like protein 4 isoform X2 [Phyllopteryx taeniolatus]|uniref:choline transporter-like protein 4 isoform X2 n=1 Tax=Phyllopteryx taeniolatus TaxID=161469 RepID=UPI002AD59A87|nr:choline transporter-like protein 4 isoform X2 [Phyllopteryx taeniolatus]